MKISNNWLKDYIKTDLSSEKIGAFLTDIGLEVEGTYPRKKLNSGQFNADLLGNKITNTVTNYIDDKHLIPETELVKPPIL